MKTNLYRAGKINHMTYNKLNNLTAYEKIIKMYISNLPFTNYYISPNSRGFIIFIFFIISYK